VAGARDQKLYLAYRTGRFSYEIALPNGDYDLTLRFVEPVQDQAVGKRVFDVLVQGKVEMADLDLAAAVGAMKAFERTVTLQVVDGKGRIEFVPKAGEAILSSFSVRPH
jgi:beta-galactosidase